MFLNLYCSTSSITRGSLLASPQISSSTAFSSTPIRLLHTRAFLTIPRILFCLNSLCRFSTCFIFAFRSVSTLSIVLSSSSVNSSQCLVLSTLPRSSSCARPSSVSLPEVDAMRFSTSSVSIFPCAMRSSLFCSSSSCVLCPYSIILRYILASFALPFFIACIARS